MSPTAKLLTTGITGAGVVGGGVGAYYAKDYLLKDASSKIQDSKPKKISFRKRLQDNGKKLLDKVASGERWEYKFNTYQAEKAKLNNELDIKDALALRSFCESKLDFETEESDAKLLLDLEKICTSPTNKERLQKEGKKLIEDEQDWAKKAQDYKSHTSGAEAIPEIKMGTEDKEAMKKWCNSKIEKEYENDGDYGIFLQWCTKAGK